MSVEGFLGIDAGTQGLSVTFTDREMRVLATGDGEYAMVPGLPEGCYEQRPEDWEAALQEALRDVAVKMQSIASEWTVLAVGISGQMHGEVLVDAAGQPLAPARLWCDARNEEEGNELTRLLGVKMPKRITASRWLWTLRNRADQAAPVAHLTTPGGWLAYRLTGEFSLGVGDASGMFPIDPKTGTYDRARLDQFDQLTAALHPPAPLGELLPTVRMAGQAAGVVSAEAAERTGLPAGIPVAPAEGDQPAAMAGSLIADAGLVSISLGTSVCANAVGDRVFEGVHPAIDHFCAADGKPINMVWLRNGTTYMNCIVQLFAGVLEESGKSGFAAVIPKLLEAPADCGGLLALPFMDDEPGLEVPRGGCALVVGLTKENATPGNVAKAALLATIFNLRYGMDELSRQGFPRTELVLSGGLVRDPEIGQIVANALDTPCSILDSATEGSGWGAALTGKFRWLRLRGDAITWGEFMRDNILGTSTRFEPISTEVAQYDASYARYLRLLKAVPSIDEALNTPL